MEVDAVGRRMRLLDEVLQTPGRDIWLTIDELAYYRPLTFSLWRLTYDVGQGHMLTVDRAINLVLHAINGALVGILAFRLWQGGGSGWLKADQRDQA